MREEPTVAYLGPKTSYSHQAAEKCFPGEEFFLVPKKSIQAVVDAVQAGDVDRGVIPFENSSQGPVFPTLDTLSHSHLSCSDLSIVGETSLKIQHCLLVRPLSSQEQLTPPDSPPESSASAESTDADGSLAFDSPVFSELKRIRHVYSHPQALGQCKDFISRMLPQAEVHSTNSTAEAAQRIAQDTSDTLAAIGSSRTARELGLKVLLEGMQDVRDNSTRFIVLKRDGLSALGPVFRRASLAMLESLPKEVRSAPETRKLLVSFAIDNRTQQGKLVRALGTFDKPSIQVTGIHSRPSRKSPFHYVYFVEASFISTSGSDADMQVKETLRDLGKVAQSRRCHGSWGPTLEW